MRARKATQRTSLPGLLNCALCHGRPAHGKGRCCVMGQLGTPHEVHESRRPEHQTREGWLLVIRGDPHSVWACFVGWWGVMVAVCPRPAIHAKLLLLFRWLWWLCQSTPQHNRMHQARTAAAAALVALTDDSNNIPSDLTLAGGARGVHRYADQALLLQHPCEAVRGGRLHARRRPVCVHDQVCGPVQRERDRCAPDHHLYRGDGRHHAALLHQPPPREHHARVPRQALVPNVSRVARAVRFHSPGPP
jgi:hypothetical protein